jgi:glyceraldehyde 3-phosphate dehydrogenase
MNIAINGFGRIGRAALKTIIAKNNPNLNVVAINDLTDNKTLAHLFKYDSAYGLYEKEVGYDEGNLIVAGWNIRFSRKRIPKNCLGRVWRLIWL